MKSKFYSRRGNIGAKRPTEFDCNEKILEKIMGMKERAVEKRIG